MEIYETEDQQVEALRKWWKENGVALVVGVVVGLAGLFGYRAWLDYRNAAAEMASELHAGVLNALQGGQPELVVNGSQRLRDEYSGTPYAALAALAEAKARVQQGDLAAARGALEWVVANADLPETVAVARLRLARLLFDGGDFAAARAELERLPPAAFAAQAAELRGDLLREQGDREGARAAYREALDKGGENRAVVQMKLDDLGLELAAEGAR